MEPYSVLMAVYAGENAAYFEKALESIRLQSVPPAEILLVCDGPLTDALEQVIAAFSRENPSLLRLHRLETNQGLGPALNAGLALCRHELVARMDSDDLSVPNRMGWQLQRMAQHPEICALGGQIAEFRGSPEHIFAYRKVPLTHLQICGFAARRNPMNHVTVMLRKTPVLKAGGYPDFSGPGFEDYDLWVRLLAAGCKMENLPQVCCHVRVDQRQYFRRGGLGYFRNACRVQKQLRRYGMVSFPGYLRNLAVWFGSSLLLTAGIRRQLCLRFLRSRTEHPAGMLRDSIRREEGLYEASGYQS